jgi:hypothetical protein
MHDCNFFSLMSSAPASPDLPLQAETLVRIDDLGCFCMFPPTLASPRVSCGLLLQVETRVRIDDEMANAPGLAGPTTALLVDRARLSVGVAVSARPGLLWVCNFLSSRASLALNSGRFAGGGGGGIAAGGGGIAAGCGGIAAGWGGG